MSENYSVTVLGGGTGTRAVLSGLREHPVDLTAVINMSDNGGSSGILRREMGVPPPGDVRQAIAALSASPEHAIASFEHRVGPDLARNGSAAMKYAGHPVGNLLLANMMTDLGVKEGIKAVSDMFRVTGRVLPVTEDVHDLCAKVDGQTVVGEYEIGQTVMGMRPKLWLSPEPSVDTDAYDAITDADMVVIAPGDLYGSLAPTLLVRGVAKAISERRGRLVYVANLLNKPNQTAGFGAEDYVAEVERFADCQMDMVVQNTGDVDEGWLVGHAQPGEQIVRPADNLPGVELIGLDMVDRDLEPDMTKSMVTKSFVRHDGSRVAGALLELAYA